MRNILLTISFILISLLVIISCNKKDKLHEPDLINANTRLDSMIIIIGSNVIPADSLTYTNVKLVVDTNIYKKYKQVTFTISPVGKFSNDSSSITVPISISDTAYTKVFSNQSGRAYITAMVGNVTVADSIVFTSNIDTLTMTIASNTIFADSITFDSVNLKVDANLYAKYRQASFTISPVGRFGNDSTRITVPIGIDSIARTSVFSNVSGPAYITATVGNITKTKPITFTAYSVTVNLTPTTNAEPADNSTYATITATALDPNVLLKMNTITFTTTKGTFANNAMVFPTSAFSNNSGTITATAYLKDNNVETAIVSATLSNTSIYTLPVHVTFTTAYPTQLLIYPLHPAMNATVSLQDTITTKLVRSTGKASAGQLVNFSEFGIRNGSLATNFPGIFYNTTLSDTTGTATTIFFLEDTSFHGYVHIIGMDSTTNSSGVNVPLLDTTIIYVQ